MSWVIYSKGEDWSDVFAIMDEVGISMDIMFSTMGGEMPEDKTEMGYHDMMEWLVTNVEPAEGMGFINYEFNMRPPKPDPNLSYEYKKQIDQLSSGKEALQRADNVRSNPNLEWLEVADLPSLPHGSPDTEQEKKVGVKVRQMWESDDANNPKKPIGGSFYAVDLYGMGHHFWGNTPQEALAKLYMQLTGRMPYKSGML